MGYKGLFVLWFPIFAAGADSQRYIVELSGDSVAEHVAKDRRRAAKPVEMDSDVARTRQTQLRSEQQQVRKKLEDLGVKVLDSTEAISNSLIVDMPDELADKVAAIPGVKRVQKARTFKPTLDHAVVLHKVPQAWNRIGVDKAGLGIKIAIVDSGIEISHPGMQDSTLRLPDGFPKMNADSDVAFTNSKVIVARSYARLFSTAEDDISARDVNGHGTAAAMAAAGAKNTGPLGSIQGIATKAYLGSYKVLGANGAGSSDIILKAVDDAVKDGMDVINASISSAVAAPRLEDDLEVDAFERVAGLGILMVNSAGNKGDPNTIGSPATAPSVIAVGASYNDRTFFEASVKVGDGPLLGATTGSGPRPNSPVSGPLFDVSTLDKNGEACLPFPIGSMTGKIALIMRSPLVGGGNCSFETKLNNVQGGGAIAAVIYTNIDRPVGFMNVGAATLPALMLSNVDGVAIKKRLAADTLIARMDFTTAAIPAPSDSVADFSSRGPNVNGSIKPDLVAVGTDFYTATESTVPTGELYRSAGYIITDGTSFSAPLVAGAAALLKGARPGLTAAQYRSLLINTAAPITARVQEAGAGLLDMNAALQSTFAIAPTSLSLGIGGANPKLSKTLTISNVGTSAESYSLMVVPRNARVPAPVLGVNTVTVQPGQSASVPITFSGSSLTAGQYEGFLNIRGTVSAIEGRVPYWYGVASDVPAKITPLYVKGKDDFIQYKAGTRVNNAINFRVTDASGIIVANAQPTVTAFSGGGSVISTVSLDRTLPGVFSVSVQLGVGGGNNVFRITAGKLEPLDVPITGQIASLTATPGSVNVAYKVGDPPPQQVLRVTAEQPGVGFTVVPPTVPWLSVTPDRAAAPVDITLRFLVAGMGAGRYTTTLTLARTTPAGNLAIPITLLISAGAALIATPASVSFSDAGSAPAVQLINLDGFGRNVSFTVSVDSDGGWLSVTPTTGSTPATLTARAAIGNRPSGGYPGTITINVAGSAPVVINAGLRVGVIPEVAEGGAVRAAGNGPGPFAGGSLLTIYGNFLLDDAIENSVLPVPATLGGFAATIAGQAARPFFVSRNQVNLQIPYGIPLGRTQLVATVKGVRALPYPIEIAAVGPGLILYGDGRQVVAQNQDYTLNSRTNPVPQKGVLIVYGTGQGDLDVAIPTGAVAPSDPLAKPKLAVRATIGGVSVRAFAAMTPGLVGLLQANLDIDSVPQGEQELILYVGDIPSNKGMVYIGR